MTYQILPLVLDKILSNINTPVAVFSALVPALGDVLNCDRVFLYLRNPETQMGRVPYCWRRNSNYPEVWDPEW
ncbi:GAF domain-containing protein, partial [Microcoleus sp. HI-ES]|nr:GAF domain-containing protein [Microcoleus sp. HI-ES]